MDPIGVLLILSHLFFDFVARLDKSIEQIPDPNRGVPLSLLSIRFRVLFLSSLD